MEKDYTSVDDLLKDRLHCTKENKATVTLINDLAGVLERGYLTRDEFIKICEWKSPRNRRRFENNTDDDIKDVTNRAFSEQNEMEKAFILCKLKGVRIPTASAILSLVDPQHYGVIDWRCWKVFYKFECVSSNPNGVNLTKEDWYLYLTVLRTYAARFKTSVRMVELTLFESHQSGWVS